MPNHNEEVVTIADNPCNSARSKHIVVVRFAPRRANFVFNIFLQAINPCKPSLSTTGRHPV